MFSALLNMKNQIYKLFIAGLLILKFIEITASTFMGISASRDTSIKAPLNWFNLDPEMDSFYGISTERAYRELLSDKKPSQKIVIAILDTGVDFMHEDLKAKIWTNPGEIPDNGIDDDKNGYIDDVRGWNFLGGKDGTPVIHDTYEVTRLYARYKPIFENIDTTRLNGKTKKEYELYKKIRTDYDKLVRRNESMMNTLNSMKERYEKAERIIAEYFGTDSLSNEQLEDIDTGIDSVDLSAQFIARLMKMEFNPEKIQKAVEKIDNTINYCLNLEYDPRYIVGDNYADPEERYYGNPLVRGPEPTHGTHVSGVIAADRSNNTGINGIAENVELMILRVVPDGDERDKDIASAVYYAVDNGARIINMSFGKGYSPFKESVDKAFQYASKHGVLIVHAAGNDSENNDKVFNYPSRFYCSGKECKTWIEVGAISWKNGTNKISGFTNYGRKNVDLFAPGEDIYSTIPGDKYRDADGTSMAAPVVSGVAALVWSYYPDLSTKQLKKIILKSSVKIRQDKVSLPGHPEKTVRFRKLSGTGGIVNAFRALQMAEMKVKKTTDH